MESSYSTSQGAGGSLGDQARQQGQQMVDQAKQTAGQLAGQARQQVTTQINAQKETAAGSLQGVARALHSAADQLERQQQAPIGQYAHTAAQMVDGWSGYLREHDLEDMIQDVENFGRRQPAVFIGGALVLGFLAARFLKSSAESSAYRQQQMEAGPRLRTSYEMAMARPTGQREPGIETARSYYPPDSPVAKIGTDEDPMLDEDEATYQSTARSSVNG